MRRVHLDGLNVEPLELGKITAVDITKGRGMILLEEMPDGRWRLTYTKKTVPDIAMLESLRIERDV